MSVRRSVTLQEPPPKVLAALATAGENLGYDVRRADSSHGLIVMTSPWTWAAASLGFVATASLETDAPEVRVELDVTARLGFWSLKSSGRQATDLVQEMGSVLQAPQARIRRPEQTGSAERPFGVKPEIAGGLWGLSTLLVYGLLVGGNWWVPALAGAVGGLLLALPHPSRTWSLAVLVLGLISFPFGFIGLSLRREALAQAYWRAIKGEGWP